MSATDLQRTTSLIGYNTTAGRNWSYYNGNKSDLTYEMDPNEIITTQARHIPIILFSVSANLFIIVIILSNKSLRTQAFFLGVLSISIFDLLNGAFVLPMKMEHVFHWVDSWRHGQNVCTAFQIISISKALLSSLMNIAVCGERLLAKLTYVAAISKKMASTFAGVLIFLPWGIGSLVCAPILVSNREDVSQHFGNMDKFCVFVLEEASHIPIIVTMYLVPFGLLLLVPAVMLVVYKYKHLRWHRLSTETVEPEAVKLYMSTLSAWIASVVYVVLHCPLAVLVSLFVMCTKGKVDCPDILAYVNATTVATISSAVTPFVWIITVEIRAVLSSIKASITRFAFPTDGRKSVLSFSSLRNKMSSDDTVVLS
ncbi:uncharacterized protein LOC132546134 [Ylistrum balloti]|uniref:uncharacterized protein LOC132546134 n=1 Tax=Ylistrum balloti TaxID=509963 RepID=UPI002905A850|nr:uncharacterized protein LOC132546134 [Ylistrum balloti]